jgi:hypothetical protein
MPKSAYKIIAPPIGSLTSWLRRFHFRETSGPVCLF